MKSWKPSSKSSGKKPLRLDSRPLCPWCKQKAHFSFSGRDYLLGGNSEFDYYRCSLCEIEFQWPLPSPREVASFYPSHYEPYSPPRRRRPSHMKEAILKEKYGYRHLDTRWFEKLLAPFLAPFLYRDSPHWIPGGKALDLGCGNGEFMLYLKELGWEVQGVEFHSETAEICRQLGLDVITSTVEEMSLAPCQFHLIWASHLIEHLRRPQILFEKAARLLLPGGKLVIRTPNARALGRTWLKKHWYGNDVPRHLFLFTHRALDSMASRWNFAPQRREFFTTPKHLLNSLDYWRYGEDRKLRRVKWARTLARVYRFFAWLTREGDELFLVYHLEKS